VSFFVAFKRALVDIIISILFIIEHIIILYKIDTNKFSGKTFSEINDLIYNISPTPIWLLIIALLWSFSEFITLLFNKKKRAIHDFIGGTIVLDLSSKQKDK
jgi:uncharacterized RDD family membrane protein YckC